VETRGEVGLRTAEPVGAADTRYAEVVRRFAVAGAPPRAKPVGRAVKRAFDVVVAATVLLLFAPLLLAAGLAVRLSSPGPAIFRQERVGRRGRPFQVLKFRTMVVDQASVIDLRMVEEQQQRGILVKLEADPRVTRVGAILRRTSIDELPQLVNVLRGDMSLVGPRPLIPFMLEPYPELAQLRSVMRPGLTGLWQVSARGDNTTALGMAEPDLTYVTQFRLRTDARILVRTLPRLVRGEGAV
jgi:lipopolysaccharide/colanic/teichoic acid biosynthesis glycosyltransferase